MRFDIKILHDSVAQHGRVVRVVIADVAGSSPREVGAAMLVWADGQSGTIGGGALEHEAAQTARARLAVDNSLLTHHALGPDLGQCCGGRVSLLFEPFDVKSVSELSTDVIARPITVDNPEMPLSVTRMLSRARGQGIAPKSMLIDGWMVEPVLRPTRQVWIWGAGHVGRALVDVLSPLPDVALTWVDTAAERFPETLPQVTVISQENPADIVKYAPVEAEHYILTYSHALDLELCHQILLRGSAFAGLIGSKTKWARFRNRLSALGHPPERIAGITCPIGDPSLGKHPAHIAIGVAQDLLARRPATPDKKEIRA